MQTTLNKLANYLIIMLPIFLITGPFLSDLSVVLIDLIFIYFVIKEKKFNYFNNFVFKILLLFNLYISLRSLFAEDIFVIY